MSFFNPLFSGPPSYPPVGSNFGFYNNPAVNTMIDQAAKRPAPRLRTPSGRSLTRRSWQDAPIYPITDGKWPLYHASYVHNAVYLPAFEQFDPTNVWLSTP